MPYIEKLRTVEAYQFLGDTAAKDAPAWFTALAFRDATDADNVGKDANDVTKAKRIKFHDPERIELGSFIANVDDWVVRPVDGRLGVFTDEVFQASYVAGL